MSLLDSKGSLSAATKELMRRWNDVNTIWSDAQSQAFERTYLALIEQDVRSALAAMDHMNMILQSIRNDCE